MKLLSLHFYAVERLLANHSKYALHEKWLEVSSGALACFVIMKQPALFDIYSTSFLLPQKGDKRTWVWILLQLIIILRARTQEKAATGKPLLVVAAGGSRNGRCCCSSRKLPYRQEQGVHNYPKDTDYKVSSLPSHHTAILHPVASLLPAVRMSFTVCSEYFY
jgi:hypothetical protein